MAVANKLVPANEYGQLEINKLEARATGQMEAQAPFGDCGDLEYAENGMILAYDATTNTLIPATSSTAAKDCLLLACVEKQYDPLHSGLKDFRIDLKKDFLPRAFYLNPGDVFTTNTVITADGTASAVAAGNPVGVDATAGYLKVGGSNVIGKVVKVTTMPDGSPALKIRVL